MLSNRGPFLATKAAKTSIFFSISRSLGLGGSGGHTLDLLDTKDGSKTWTSELFGLGGAGGSGLELSGIDEDSSLVEGGGGGGLDGGGGGSSWLSDGKLIGRGG